MISSGSEALTAKQDHVSAKAIKSLRLSSCCILKNYYIIHFIIGHYIVFKFDFTFHSSNFEMNIHSPSNNLDNVIKEIKKKVV